MRAFIYDTIDACNQFVANWGPEFPAMYSFIFFLNY